LANPLKTCSLLVERRGDAIALEFQHGSPAQQFALATLDVTKGGNAKSFLEPTVDSSRYFVVKIQGDGGKREALIGFGFRDRDAAIDLREALQHYEKSLQRQEKAASSLTGSFSIPPMEEGQQIHVNIGNGKKSSTSVRKKEKGSAAGSAPTLLKKPPPPAAEEENQGGKQPTPHAAASAIPDTTAPATTTENPKIITKMAISMGDIDLDAEHIKHTASGDGADDSDENSGGAVYVGDEEQWKTEFDMPK
jgi:adaptin ear-binding coat-associated protein 1/2